MCIEVKAPGSERSFDFLSRRRSVPCRQFTVDGGGEGARRPALLCFSAAHEARPRPTARTFADTVTVLASSVLEPATTSSPFDPRTTDASRAAFGGWPACAHGARRRAEARPAAAMSAAPSSAASGSAREARFVLLTRGDC
ncbi:MAG TPA: hypothetical protein PKB08_15145, partial [Burkholderiaceae bacterium]|nr:hypothetical protein [Burkholderiaceae bacterium]